MEAVYRSFRFVMRLIDTDGPANIRICRKGKDN